MEMNFSLREYCEQQKYLDLDSHYIKEIANKLGETNENDKIDEKFLNRSADQWNDLGDSYFYGEENKSNNRFIAFCCYKIATSKDHDHTMANQSLAKMYFKGVVIVRNIAFAEFYALKANTNKSKHLIKKIKTKLPLANKSYEEGTNLFYQAFNHKTKTERLEKLENALKEYKTAISHDPTNVEANYSLAVLYLSLDIKGKLVEAKNYCNKVLAVNSKHYLATKLLLLIRDQLEDTFKNEIEWNGLGIECLSDHKYLEARCCFEIAVSLNPDYVHANFNLAHLYYFANGVEQDLNQAEKYCEKAIKTDPKYLSAIKLMLRIKEDPKQQNNADQWNKLGVKIFKQKNYLKSHYCTEIAITKEPTHKCANRNLAYNYYYGYGVEKNLKQAEKYCEIAIKTDPKFLSAIKLMLCIKEDPKQQKNPGQWSDLGVSFFNGKGKYQKDFVKENCCYEIALKKDPKHVSANKYIAYNYYYGYGVQRNYQKAKEYCSTALAVSPDDEFSLKLKFRIEDSLLNQQEDITAWNNLGLQYMSGEKLNYIKAQCCFELGLEKDNQDVDLNFNLAFVHEKLYAATKKHKDYTKSKDYYLKSHANTNKKSHKKKSEIRLLILKEKTKTLDEKDINGGTLFHFVAKQKSIKNSARLYYFSKSKEIEDNLKRTPPFYLTDTERDTISKMREKIDDNAKALVGKSTEDILAKSVKLDGNIPNDINNIKAAFTELNKIPEIQPLLELVKYAVEGCHRLSTREKLKFDVNDFDHDNFDNGYDSDDDEQPINVVNKNHQFAIIINPDAETVADLTLFGNNGLGGNNALGVYKNRPDPFHDNAVYIGGKSSNKLKVRGTIIHELTHFIAREVFDNDCLPYPKGNLKGLASIFNAIEKELSKNKQRLPNILKGAYSSWYVENQQVHHELIVRIPQMLVEMPSYNLNQGITKPLFEYFTNHFLEAVKLHILKLEKIVFKDTKELCKSRIKLSNYMCNSK